MKEDILVFCSHPDDQVIGVGGTMAKYAKEGKKVIVIIMSRGEGSHPWYKRKHTIAMRDEETIKADKVIGVSKTINLNLMEKKFLEDEKKTIQKIAEIIKKHKPTKVFTHTLADTHKDHKATRQLVTGAYDKIKCKCDMYTFDIWNPINLKETHAPKLAVDISKTFKTKIRALKCFKSQWISIIQLIGFIYYRAITLGLKHNYKYAEVFYKVR